MRNGASTARLGASVLDRYERRTRNGGKIGIVQLSDPSGTYEAIMFQEGLSQFRDLLEKGADVLVTLQASVEGEDVRARIVNVERLTEAAAKVQKGLQGVRARRGAARIDRAAPDRARRRRGVAGRDPRGRRTARSRSACPAAIRSARRSPARSRPRPGWWRWSRSKRAAAALASSYAAGPQAGLTARPLVRSACAARLASLLTRHAHARKRAFRRPLGDSSTVEQRTLTPSILVRIQVPQPNLSFSPIWRSRPPRRGRRQLRFPPA